MKESNFCDIEKVNDNLYIVFNKTNRGFDTLVSIVSRQMIKIDFEGKVVFDLLLSNSVGSSRYIETEFNKKGIITSSIAKMKKLPPEVSLKSKKYFKSHPNLLLNGVLTKSQIEKIKNELFEI